MSVLTRSRERIGSLVAESVYDNPVVTRELRTRMRGLKGFLLMGGYALLGGVVLFITYMILWNEHPAPYGTMMVMNIANRNVGLQMFRVLVWTQAILLSLAIPALTFSSMTQELERKSMELLALTRLSAARIVLGKQLSGFLYSLVLLGCTLPLSSMCLMFGGVSPAEIAVMYAILVAWAFLLTCMGVFWSSLFNRTASAALFAYGVTGLYFLLTLPLGIIAAPPIYAGAGDGYALGALNPGWAAYSAMLESSVCGVKVSPALAAVLLHGVLGVLLLLVASTHVRFHKVRRSVSIKLLTIVFTLGLVWLGVGGLPPSIWNASHTNAFRNLLGIASALILVLLCLFATVFATGEMRKAPGKSMFAHALSLRRIFSADLSGGMLFMAVWAAVLCGGVLGTLWWVSKAQSIAVPRAVWDAGLKMGVFLVCLSFGVSAVGVLGSSLVKARRNAAALVLLFVILAWSGYGIVLAYYVDGVTDTSGPVWQLAALWPMTPIISLDGWRYMPKLWWNPKDAWLVCSAAYLAIAVLALALASAPANEGGGVKEE